MNRIEARVLIKTVVAAKFVFEEYFSESIYETTADGMLEASITTSAIVPFNPIINTTAYAVKKPPKIRKKPATMDIFIILKFVMTRLYPTRISIAGITNLSRIELIFIRDSGIGTPEKLRINPIIEAYTNGILKISLIPFPPIIHTPRVELISTISTS